jgi:hypothetical protein
VYLESFGRGDHDGRDFILVAIVILGTLTQLFMAKNSEERGEAPGGEPTAWEEVEQRRALLKFLEQEAPKCNGS